MDGVMIGVDPASPEGDYSVEFAFIKVANMRLTITTELKAGRCKSCNESIYWIKTVKGKWLPVNRRAIMCTPVQKGGHTFVLVDGSTVQALPEGTVPYDGVDSIVAFEAHFATCPDAAAFRKKKRRQQ